ncbi:hypothetical protein [Erwinia sp. E_sp_B01_9]|uniref:hypothetical protein n=1 Tax=unclassified Erwinia TaxID=2622719 RepID=UPI003D9B7DC6
MAQAGKLAPKRVVYLSCNPTTLAQDSQKRLTSGYQLERVMLPDVFRISGSWDPGCYLAENGLPEGSRARRGYGCGKKCTFEYGWRVCSRPMDHQFGDLKPAVM